MRPMELAGEIARKAAIPAFAVVMGVGGVACSGGNQESALRVSGPTNSTENGRQAANACAGGYDLTANLANELFADRSSVFPSLDTKQGDLLPTNKAVDVLQKQTGSDFRVAAVMSEIYNIRDNRKSPDTLTIPGFQSAVDTMKKNNNSVAKRVEYVCNQLSFVEPNKSDFVVVGGSATEISFMRDEKGVAGIILATIPKDRAISGFVLGANFDNTKLKAEDRKFFEQFKRDVIVTEDGKIVIRNLALNGGISVQDQKAEAPASSTQDNNGGGHFGSRNGKGEDDQPGSVPESGGNGGRTPGTQPSFGPGTSTTTRPGGGGTTTTTSPRTTTTTIPGTTTTTTSSTTRPPVVTTTTTIPTPKGTVPPCVENPPYAYC